MNNLLKNIAHWIPRLFDAIAQGNAKSEIRLKSGRVDGKEYVLKLVAEVEDD